MTSKHDMTSKQSTSPTHVTLMPIPYHKPNTTRLIQVPKYDKLFSHFYFTYLIVN